MGFEMVADDDDVCTGSISGVHGFGCPNSTAHDEGTGCDITYRTDDVRRDRYSGTRTGFKIDGFFTHQFGSNAGINNSLKV